MSDLPSPLVPAEVDLRDFGFMPLDVRTLLSSSLWIKAKKDPRVAHAAISLWCESWHQVPCASLPDDDEVLAELARCDPKEWKRVKERALQQFVKCSDGRLYHRHVARKAMESWDAKVAQRERTLAATAAREAKRRAQQKPPDDVRDVKRDEQRDVQRDDVRDVDQGTVKGQGQGIGSVPSGTGAEAPLTDRDVVFASGVALLTAAGVKEANARSFLAMQCKGGREADVRAALERCAVERPIQPVPWLQAVLGPPPVNGAKHRKSDALMAGNIAAAQRYLDHMEAP